MAAIIGPVRPVIELGGIPDDLVEELRHAHGVGGGAWATGLECAKSEALLGTSVFFVFPSLYLLGIRHMVHVVRRIEILAVPAAIKSR